VVVAVRIDRKYNGALYVSFIWKNKDKDIKNDSYTYYYDWSVDAAAFVIDV
jgi:hypothetical protein